jgi:branched-chain amino acid transport system substrate-binding protein
MRKPLGFVITGAALVLSACGTSVASNPSPQSTAPITIGVSLSFSGDFSSDGNFLKQGYDLWAQDINGKGGLLGHPVRMQYVDDASSTQQVVTNYQNLITQDKVDLVFGGFSSKLTIPASTVVDRYNYAFPEPAGGGPDVFNRGLKSVFFVQPAAVEDNLVSYTEWVKAQSPRPQTVAYATENDPFTQPQVDKAKSLLEAAGLTTAYYHVYSSEPIDWSPFALAVVHSNADVVVLGTQLPDALAFLKVFAAQHYNPKSIIETTGPDQGSSFSDPLGKNTEGIMVPAGWTPDAKAYGNDLFVARYITKFGGTPAGMSADTAEAYSVGQVVDQAVTKAGSLDNKALITALHSGTYQTVQGPISFDGVGKPHGVGVYIEQWQSGQAIFVYPTTVASAKPEYPKANWQ